MQAKGNTIGGSSVYAIGIEFFNPSFQKIEGPVCGDGVPHRRLLDIRGHDSNFAESGRNLSQRNDPRTVDPVIVCYENTHKGFLSCSCSKIWRLAPAGLQRVSNRARGRAGARTRSDNAEEIALRRRRYGTDVYF